MSETFKRTFMSMVVEIEKAKQAICEKINLQAEQYLHRLDQRIEGFVTRSDDKFNELDFYHRVYPVAKKVGLNDLEYRNLEKSLRILFSRDKYEAKQQMLYYDIVKLSPADKIPARFEVDEIENTMVFTMKDIIDLLLLGVEFDEIKDRENMDRLYCKLIYNRRK